MKVSIEFECVNAAFQDDLAREVLQLLSKAVPKILLHAIQEGRGPETESQGRLRDTNGNTVGSIVIRG